MKDIKIEIASVATVTFCGEKNNNLNAVYANAKTLADQYGGKILRDKELSDGYFLEVLFTDEEMEVKWKNSIGLQ